MHVILNDILLNFKSISAEYVRCHILANTVTIFKNSTKSKLQLTRRHCRLGAKNCSVLALCNFSFLFLPRGLRVGLPPQNNLPTGDDPKTSVIKEQRNVEDS